MFQDGLGVISVMVVPRCGWSFSDSSGTKDLGKEQEQGQGRGRGRGREGAGAGAPLFCHPADHIHLAAFQFTRTLLNILLCSF